MKSELFKKNNTILRVLDKEENDILAVDCIKKRMPAWISKDDLASYTPITELDLLKTIGNLPTNEVLDNRQNRVMHEHFTMIADIL